MDADDETKAKSVLGPDGDDDDETKAKCGGPYKKDMFARNR